MRLLTLLAAAGLGISAWLAPQVRDARSPDPIGRSFVEPDLERRVALGREERALGVELSAWEEAVRERPDDIEALRGRFATGMLLGAVALGEPRLNELVAQQSDLYLERREEMDPDGSLLQDTVRTWCQLRLDHPYLYASCSVAMYMAARGEDRGFEALRYFMEHGRFYDEFFPYSRKFHCHWRAVRPLVEHYLTGSELGGRIEAGATLLEYNIHYGLGADLMERYLARIRADFREIQPQLRAARLEGETWVRGRTALHGMAMLAALGYEEERTFLEQVTPFTHPHHMEPYRVALVWAGLAPFDRYLPTGQAYLLLPPDEKIAYFYALAQHASLLYRERSRAGLDEQRAVELDRRLDLVRGLLDVGYHAQDTVIRVVCIRTLALVTGPAARPMLQEVIDGRGVPSLFAGALVEDLEDPVAVFLPGLRSPHPDYAALAAVSLLDLDANGAIQRPGDRDPP